MHKIIYLFLFFQQFENYMFYLIYLKNIAIFYALQQIMKVRFRHG